MVYTRSLDMTFASSGFLPHVHAVLLPSKVPKVKSTPAPRLVGIELNPGPPDKSGPPDGAATVCSTCPPAAGCDGIRCCQTSASQPKGLTGTQRPLDDNGEMNEKSKQARLEDEKNNTDQPESIALAAQDRPTKEAEEGKEIVTQIVKMAKEAQEEMIKHRKIIQARVEQQRRIDYEIAHVKSLEKIVTGWLDSEEEDQSKKQTEGTTVAASAAAAAGGKYETPILGSRLAILYMYSEHSESTRRELSQMYAQERQRRRAKEVNPHRCHATEELQRLRATTEWLRQRLAFVEASPRGRKALAAAAAASTAPAPRLVGIETNPGPPNVQYTLVK